MKYDIQLIFTFVAFGLLLRKPTWKAWFAISLVVLSWMMFNIWKGHHS